jgi:EmrB/QacA subfamily drug resistance transporter
MVELANANRNHVLIVMCTGLMLVIMDNTIVNVALPTIAKDTSATSSQLQWIVDAYLLVFGGTLLTMGSLGDRFGRRGAFQVGATIVALGSVAAQFVNDPNELIAIRAFMGLGGALVMPATLSTIVAVFPPSERARAIATWAGLAGAGNAVGLLLGGWLLEHFDWQSVFTVNVPLAAAAILLTFLLVPTSRDPEKTPLDIPGTIFSIVALVSTFYAIIEGPIQGATAPIILWALLVAACAWIAFIVREATAKRPMLPLHLFKDRGFAAGAFTMSMVFLAMLTTFFVLTQYMQFIEGYAPLDTGLRFLPLVVGIGAGAGGSVRLGKKVGPAYGIGAGLLLACIVTFGLSTLTATTPYWELGLLFVGLGAGLGLVMAPTTNLIMTGVPGAQAGLGSAMNDTTRQIGGALGIALLGSVLNTAYANNLVVPSGLPAPLKAAASQSVAVALLAADHIGGPTGAHLKANAIAAFITGLRETYLVAGIFLAAVFVIAVLALPRTNDADARVAAAERRHVQRYSETGARSHSKATGAVLIAASLAIVAAGAGFALAYTELPAGEVFDFASLAPQKVLWNSSLPATVSGETNSTAEKTIAPNLTQGQAVFVLQWQAAAGNGSKTLTGHVLMGGRVIASATGPGPGIRAISPPLNFSGPLSFEVVSNGTLAQSQPFEAILIVATPQQVQAFAAS